jgi:4-diphosphocytidyl-2-C-methyl-D-erythritol kinase
VTPRRSAGNGSPEPLAGPTSRCSIACHAKVNLHLQVIGRRGDGYHELRTVFQTIDLADELTVELGGEGVRLTVVGAPGLSSGAENLAWRAAAGFLARWAPHVGAALHLHKRIPMGAGLGGGSSDAAGVLLALQRCLGSPAPPGELWLLARELGADVPYFLVGGTALGVGRGDEVVPLADLPPRELLLVLPSIHVSTAESFAGLGELTARHFDPRIMALVQRGHLGWESCVHATNDLEAAVFHRWPELAALHADLRATGEVARMSGSGAAMWLMAPRGPLPDGDTLPVRRWPSGTRVERVHTVPRASLHRP